MHCRDCPRFNNEVNKCQDGKLNPLGWENAVEVAQIYGIRSICAYNDFRERLLDAQRIDQPPKKRQYRIPDRRR